MLVQPIDVPLNNFPVFGISTDHGFLPSDDPLCELPSQFAAWEEVADALSKLIVAGRLRRAIEGLPILSAGAIDDPRVSDQQIQHGYLPLCRCVGQHTAIVSPPDTVAPTSVVQFAGDA